MGKTKENKGFNKRKFEHDEDFIGRPVRKQKPKKLGKMSKNDIEEELDEEELPEAEELPVNTIINDDAK